MRRTSVQGMEAEIVAALNAAGASVCLLPRRKCGLPRLLVGYEGSNYLLEVRAPGGELTPAEWRWHKQWHGHREIVRSVEEALGAIEAAYRERLSDERGR